MALKQENHNEGEYVKPDCDIIIHLAYTYALIKSQPLQTSLYTLNNAINLKSYMNKMTQRAELQCDPACTYKPVMIIAIGSCNPLNPGNMSSELSANAFTYMWFKCGLCPHYHRLYHAVAVEEKPDKAMGA